MEGRSAEIKSERPVGIIVISGLWTIGALFNISSGGYTFLFFLEVLLSNPRTDGWFAFGIPAMTFLSFLIVVFGFAIFYAIYGLMTAKPWSYRLGLAVPLIITVINTALLGLYLSCPVLEIKQAALGVIPFIFGNAIAMVVYWGYLTRKHVKEYLASTSWESARPPPSSPLIDRFLQEKTKQSGEKFCRYCGVENKADAKYCETCGKDLG